jgi:hypothetical protein
MLSAKKIERPKMLSAKKIEHLRKVPGRYRDGGDGGVHGLYLSVP